MPDRLGEPLGLRDLRGTSARPENQPSARELRNAAQLLREYTLSAEGLFTDLVEVGRQVRVQALDAFKELSGRRRTDHGVRAGGRKVGRNEPCPCASGKK